MNTSKFANTMRRNVLLAALIDVMHCVENCGKLWKTVETAIVRRNDKAISGLKLERSPPSRTWAASPSCCARDASMVVIRPQIPIPCSQTPQITPFPTLNLVSHPDLH